MSTMSANQTICTIFYNQALQNQANNLNTQAGWKQNLFGNQTTGLNTLSNLYGQQNSLYNNALSAQSGLTQQQLSNILGVNEQNAGLYGSLIDSATSPIAAAAAAQEAAQSPAINLWNASLGLNSAPAGALASIAGKYGTTTQRSGGGSFLGNMATGLLGGFASGAGYGLFNR